MLGTRRRRGTRRLWAVAAAAAVLSLTVAGATLPAANAQRAPRGSFGADTVAKFVFDLAKEPLRNYIMDQLGLPTTSSQLKELGRKIDALRAQVAAAEVRISAQVQELKAQTRLDFLADVAVDLTSLQRDYFLPLVDAVTKVKEVEEKKPVDQEARAKAILNYDEHKNSFKRRATIIGVEGLVEKIHNRLQPRDGEGVLRDYGRLIMVAHRELTPADSQRVIGLYEFLEDVQALAAWMTAEKFLAISGSSTDLIKPSMDRFLAFTASQRDGGLPNGLHAPIPNGVVIDRGPDANAATYTTANKPMFASAGTGYFFVGEGGTSQCPYLAGPTCDKNNVAVVIKRAIDERLKGFQEWRVPNGEQIAGLFAALPSRNNPEILNYLRGLFADPTLDPGPFLWITDTEGYCGGRARLYKGVSMSTLEQQAHPANLNIPCLDARLPEKLFQAQTQDSGGGLLVVRPTGQAQYLP